MDDSGSGSRRFAPALRVTRRQRHCGDAALCRATLYPPHRSIEFWKFLDQIEAAVSDNFDMHLIFRR